MYPGSEDLSEYLVSDAIIDWQTPAVRHKALELTGSLLDEVAKARVLPSLDRFAASVVSEWSLATFFVFVTAIIWSLRFRSGAWRKIRVLHEQHSSV